MAGCQQEWVFIKNAKNSLQYDICTHGIIRKAYKEQLGPQNPSTARPIAITQHGHQKTTGDPISVLPREQYLILSLCFPVGETSAQAF